MLSIVVPGLYARRQHHITCTTVVHVRELTVPRIPPPKKKPVVEKR